MLLQFSEKSLSLICSCAYMHTTIESSHASICYVHKQCIQHTCAVYTSIQCTPVYSAHQYTVHTSIPVYSVHQYTVYTSILPPVYQYTVTSILSPVYQYTVYTSIQCTPVYCAHQYTSIQCTPVYSVHQYTATSIPVYCHRYTSIQCILVQ